MQKIKASNLKIGTVMRKLDLTPRLTQRKKAQADGRPASGRFNFRYPSFEFVIMTVVKDITEKILAYHL